MGYSLADRSQNTTSDKVISRKWMRILLDQEVKKMKEQQELSVIPKQQKEASAAEIPDKMEKFETETDPTAAGKTKTQVDPAAADKTGKPAAAAERKKSDTKRADSGSTRKNTAPRKKTTSTGETHRTNVKAAALAQPDRQVEHFIRNQLFNGSGTELPSHLL